MSERQNRTPTPIREGFQPGKLVAGKALSQGLSRLPTLLLRLVFPPKCVFCGQLLPSRDWDREVCDSCLSSLPRTTPLDFRMVGDTLCICRFPLWYQGTVRQSLRRYKFRGRSFYHRCYGPFLRQCLRGWTAVEPDFVTWAPLSARRLRQRGYDQARLLAEEAARLYDQRPVPLLKKVRHTRAQSLLSAEQRRENARDAYVCPNPAGLRGARVLLVDDIVTTGSTLDNCAKALLEAGAAEVFCLALAGAVPHTENHPAP